MPKIFVYITTAMTGIYLILGFLLIFSDVFNTIISGSAKQVLGIVVLMYGLFRVYYLYKKSKQ